MGHEQSVHDFRRMLDIGRRSWISALRKCRFSEVDECRLGSDVIKGKHNVDAAVTTSGRWRDGWTVYSIFRHFSRRFQMPFGHASAVSKLIFAIEGAESADMIFQHLSRATKISGYQYIFRNFRNLAISRFSRYDFPFLYRCSRRDSALFSCVPS